MDFPIKNGNLLQKAIENGPVEIVDFPIDSMVIFQFVMLTFTRGYMNNDPTIPH